LAGGWIFLTPLTLPQGERGKNLGKTRTILPPWNPPPRSGRARVGVKGAKHESSQRKEFMVQKPPAMIIEKQIDNLHKFVD
jgi:hypothetical protein